jgi:monovalent cation/proton antiporter MnhG/PhaG subunit
MLQSFGLILILIGIFSSIFSIFTTIFKMNEVFSKQHTSGINDSFSISLIILGGAIFYFNLLFFIKSVFIIFFFIIAAATSCHCISSLYYQENLEKQSNSENDIK